MPPYAEPASSPTAHLTDEQLSDLLVSDDHATLHPHLQQCATCQNELAHLRASIGDFNTLTLAWAETRAPRAIPIPSRAALQWHRVPAWSAVAAAGVAAILLLGAQQRQAQSTASSLAAESSAHAAALADDNRLLVAIDNEISVGDQTPSDLSALGLTQAAPNNKEGRRGTSPATDLEN